MTHTVRLRAAFCGVLFAAAACTDSNPAATPSQPVPVPADPVAALSCAVDVRASTLSCRSAQPQVGPGVSATILGGQGVNVRLTSSGTAYDAGTGILRSDVTVENLTSQMLGTADGSLPDPAGVRVFFASGPTVTDGTGSVTVESADGTETFTQGGQSYIRYPGILAPGDTTAPKEWRFAVSPTVVSFAFTVYVAAPVLLEEGWVSLTPVAPSIRAGESVRLSAVVRSVTGAPVAGEKVTWEARLDGVSATLDSTGFLTVHGLLEDRDFGYVEVTATSGGERSGKVMVFVSGPAPTYLYPTIRSVELSPTLVSNDGADSVTVQVAVSDPMWMQSVEVELESSFQQQMPQKCTSSTPATGTRTVGVFACKFGFPAGARGGVWRLRSVTAWGGQTRRSLDVFDLYNAGVRSSIYVQGPLSDYIPPTLMHFAFSPDSVRTVLDTVTIDVVAMDADTGIASVKTTFGDYGVGPSVSCITPSPYRGTIREGMFRCRMRLPPVIRGDWLEVMTVEIRDRNGNVTLVTGSELASNGFPTHLKVQPDTTVPTVTALSVSPATVAANGVDSVSVTTTATDTWSGVRQMEVQLRGPADSHQQRCFATSAAGATRTLRCALRFPAGSQGAWRLDYLRVTDAAGNQRSLDAAQATAAGFSTELTVTP